MGFEPWSDGAPPPSTSNDKGTPGGVPAPLRSVAALAALAACIDGGVVWLASFSAGTPIAEHWPLFVIPALATAIAVFAVTVIDIAVRKGARSSRGRRGFPIPLHGWRKPAGMLLFGTMWVSSLLTFQSGDLPGQAERDGDRFFANNHGTITELTREQWERARAAESRWFAGGAIVFAGMAALYLTQRPTAPVE